jgi:hypothetical protein
MINYPINNNFNNNIINKIIHNNNNNNNNNFCVLVNIVWIDRGIKLAIFYNIIKYYDIILNKIIIIDNKNYRKFAQNLFPNLHFSQYTNHKRNNFYFNIRQIIRKQDIFIDYLNNYEKYINTNKIILVPWYDMNDPLITFIYNKNLKIKIKNYINFITNFSKCRRGNYFDNDIWDIVMEKIVFKNYIKFYHDKNIVNMYQKFNLLIKREISINNKLIEYPILYYLKNNPNSLIIPTNPSSLVTHKNQNNSNLQFSPSSLNNLNSLIPQINSNLPSTLTSQNNPNSLITPQNSNLPSTLTSQNNPNSLIIPLNPSLPFTQTSQNNPNSLITPQNSNLPSTLTSQNNPNSLITPQNSNLPSTLTSQNNPNSLITPLNPSLPFTQTSQNNPNSLITPPNSNLPFTQTSQNNPNSLITQSSQNNPNSLITQSNPSFLFTQTSQNNQNKLSEIQDYYDTKIKKIEIKNKNNIKFLINLMNNKLNNLNNIIK